MTTENVISFVNSKLAHLGKEVVSASFVMGKNLIDAPTGIGVIRAGVVTLNGFGTTADQSVVLAFTNPDDTTQTENVIQTVVQPSQLIPNTSVLFNNIAQIENVNVLFTGLEIVTN